MNNSSEILCRGVFERMDSTALKLRHPYIGE